MTATKNSPSGGNAGAALETSNWIKDYLQHTRIEPLTADERREVELVAAVAELGYRPAIQCRVCGAWLVAAKSVARHIGPRCAAKAVTDV